MRFVVATAAVAVLVAGLSACSTAKPTAVTKANLTMLTFQSASLTPAFWNSNIKTTLKSLPTGTTVKQILNPSLDRDTYAKTLEASGQFPDLLVSITPNDYTAAGLLKPYPKSYLDSTYQFPDGAADAKGNTYIAPSGGQILPWIYYNKAIFKKYGLTVPTTYADLVTDVKTLNAAKSGITPIEIDGAESWAAEFPLTAILSANVEAKNPNWIPDRFKNKVKFTDPDVVAAVQEQEGLIKMGAYSPTALSTDLTTADKDMIAGKSAMFMMGNWFSGSGYLTAAQAKQFGVFLFPSDSGKQVMPLSVSGSLSVSAKSKNADAAMKFAEVWSASAGPQRDLTSGDGDIPLFKNISLKQLGASVYPLFTQGYGLVEDKSIQKVAPFGDAGGAYALPPAVNTAFSAMSQALFTNSDVKAQLAKLDALWSTSAGA
jgi:multiple sugar transport system substrate-binding protein/raffinose/stachyose/melibiose transport system substrate-binding protein